MSAPELVKEHPHITDRVDEPLAVRPGKVRDVPRRDLLVRFAAGAITSVIAGVLTIVFGPRIGGIFLGFPAILAASLTLIADQEAALDAREDARGAVAGGLALLGFAAIAVLLFGHIAGALVLVAAAAGWGTIAVGLYAVLWWQRGSQ